MFNPSGVPLLSASSVVTELGSWGLFFYYKGSSHVIFHFDSYIFFLLSKMVFYSLKQTMAGLCC